jgi:hypothetical protein
MATYLPPTENLPIFDNQVFNQNDTTLTYSDAKKYFVTFPTAQGSTTITDLIAGSIDYLAPSSGSFFDIGTNQVSGGTVRIGSSAATTEIQGLITSNTNVYYTSNVAVSNTIEYLQGGISVVNMGSAGTFAFGTQRLNKIVNMWFTSTGSKTITLPISPIIGQMIFIRSGKTAGNLTLSIVTVGQLLYPSNVSSSSGSTSLVLPNIGASQWCYVASNRWMQMDTSIAPLVDTTAGTTALEIGSKVAIGNIVIGAALGQGDISIGANQTSGGTITIGSDSSATEINGALTTTGLITADGGLTIGGANGITLASSSYTPTSSQLGYYSGVTNIALTVTATTQSPIVITNLPIGIYFFSFFITSFNPSIGATQIMNYSVTTTGGATSIIEPYIFSGNSTTFQGSQTLTGVIKCTTAVNTISFNTVITSGGGTIGGSHCGYNYIKIG